MEMEKEKAERSEHLELTTDQVSNETEGEK